MRKKRDRQLPGHNLATSAAANLSRLCRQVLIIRQTKRQLPSLPPPAAPTTPARQNTTQITHDALHWHQTASTLLSENKKLQSSLKRKEQECTELSAQNARLNQMHTTMETQLAASTREILILEADRITMPLHPRRPPPHIPTSTQGKDALFWHQTCRTLQTQYMELKAELDEKIDQFLRLTAKYSKLSASLQGEYLHDMEMPSETPRAVSGCENAPP